MKSEGIDVRRISLPFFPSDLGKDVPNYLRASTGSCHDYCKYGNQETTEVKQKRPWIKKTAVAPFDSRDVLLNKGISIGKKAKVNKASDKPKSALTDFLEIRNLEISRDSKTSEASSKRSTSSEKVTEPSQKFPKSLQSKLVNEKSLFARKSAPTSGSAELEKLKRKLMIVPNPLKNRDGSHNLDLQVVGKGNGNKRVARSVNKCNKAGKHDMANKSTKTPSAHATVKLIATPKPPSSPTPLKLGAKAKAPSILTPSLLMSAVKSKPSSSTTHLKRRSIRASSSSSFTSLKLKPASIKTSPVSIPLPSVKSYKTIKFSDKKGEASKVRACEPVTTRCGSVSSKIATNLKKKESLMDTPEEAETAETEEWYEKNEEDPSQTAESGNQDIMESYDDGVPEKTLLVIKMETGNKTQPSPYDEDEIPDMQPLASLTPPLSPRSTRSAASSMTSLQDSSQYELTNTCIALPCVEDETPDIQPFPTLSPPTSPKSQFSITASNTLFHYDLSQDDSTCTESEEGYSSYDNDHFFKEAENLMGTSDTKSDKSVTIFSQNNDKDPVKLKFRRGRVVDITQENSGPRRLTFRRAKVFAANAAEDFVRKSSFKMIEATQVNTTDSSSGTVVLRHQDALDKKDARGLFNNVIEETASKLVETRKSKVKALVGAFETVISLQDGRPTTT